jgi:hypothetical protein
MKPAQSEPPQAQSEPMQAQSAPPPAGSGPSPTPGDDAHVLLRLGRWIGEHVAATVLTLVVASAVGVAITRIHGRKPPPIADQVDRIRATAAAKGSYAVINREVELHGTGVSSRLFLFRPRRATQDPVEGASDELRIYDIRNKRLKLAFRFQPKVQEVPYRFAVYGIGRFDETDREVIIGQYVHRYVDTSVPYPVALVWDESNQAYRLRPLLPERLNLRRFKNAGAWASTARRTYRATVLSDTGSTTTLRVHGMDFLLSL